MKRIDVIVSLIIGFLIGVFFFISLEALKRPLESMLKIEIPQSWLILIIFSVIFPPLTLLGLFIAFIIGKKFLMIYQMAKYVLVGALNTMVDLGVLNFLMLISGIYTGIFYSFFKAISFLTATVNSYLWNKHWTFEKREKFFIPTEYFKFLIIVIIGLLINVSIASFIVNVIGPQFGIGPELWANVGAFNAVLVAWFWNFMGAKFIVFKK